MSWTSYKGRRIGKLSKELVVASQIYEIEQSGGRVDYPKLVGALEGLVKESELSLLLRSLSDWLIVESSDGVEEGVSKRFYNISEIKRRDVEEIYNRFGKEILARKILTIRLQDMYRGLVARIHA